jgi:hypothetical protein
MPKYFYLPFDLYFYFSLHYSLTELAAINWPHFLVKRELSEDDRSIFLQPGYRFRLAKFASPSNLG